MGGLPAVVPSHEEGRCDVHAAWAHGDRAVLQRDNGVWLAKVIHS